MIRKLSEAMMSEVGWALAGYNRLGQSACDIHVRAISSRPYRGHAGRG